MVLLPGLFLKKVRHEFCKKKHCIKDKPDDKVRQCSLPQAICTMWSLEWNLICLEKIAKINTKNNIFDATCGYAEKILLISIKCTL